LCFILVLRLHMDLSDPGYLPDPVLQL